MTERIASGEIHIEVDDKSAISDLHRIEAEYERTMKAIDRQEAEAKVSANLTQFKKDMKEAEASLKKFEERSVNKDLTAGQRKYAKERAKYFKDELEALKKNAAVEDANLRTLKAKNSEMVKTEQRLLAEKKRYEEREKVLERAEKRRVAAAAAEQRDIARTERANTVAQAQKQREVQRTERLAQREMEKTKRVQERAAAVAERIRTRAERDAQRAAELRQREINAIPKMQRQYVELAQKIERLNQTRGKVRHDEKARLLVSLKVEEAAADMKALKETLERIGSPIDLEVDIHPGRDAGLALRKALMTGRDRNGIRGAMHDAGVLAGASFVNGFGGFVQRNLTPRSILKNVGGGLSAVGSKIAHSLGNLSDMTVRLGPFTATIRQAFVGLSILAPVLLDVVGALGSLVGVVGSAALGLGALGIAAGGGAALGLGGMGLVIKDVAQEFQAAKKATKAYDDAVMKFGKNSDKAGKKLDELKSVMGHVSDETVNQFRAAQGLGEAWDKATKPAHALVWKSIGQALQTATSLMPMFAKNTNESMTVAEKSTTKWMKALRSPEGKAVLDTMMDNFRRSLGPILDGLGQFAAYIGKVGAEASKYLPALSRTFRNWAADLNSTADGSKNFQNRIKGIVDSTKSLGRFLMSAGRLMKAFFGGGVEAGRSFTDSMTTTMDRWTAFLNTVEGKNQLSNFFEEAVRGTKALWNTLAPLVSSFVRWAAGIAPFVRVFFEGASAVSKLVAEILKLTGLRTPLLALITTLGALWSINKIGAATRAVVGFSQALMGLGRAQAASGAMGAAGGVMGAGGVARAGAQVATATTRLGRFRTAASGAILAATGLSAAGLGIAVGVAVAVGAIFKLSTRTLEFQKHGQAAAQAARDWRKEVENMPQLHEDTASAVLDSEQAAIRLTEAQKNVNKLQAEGKTKTEEYKQAVLDVKQAQLDQNSAARRSLDTQKVSIAAAKRETAAAKRRVDEAKKALDAKEHPGIGGAFLSNITGFRNLRNDLTSNKKQMRELEVAQARYRREQELSVLAAMNQSRALRGLGPIARAAAKSLSMVQKLGGSTLATQISVKYRDAGDAGRVAASANRALQAGVKPATIRFVVQNAKTAEDAIKRINSLEIKAKLVTILTKGGREAVTTLERIIGRRLTQKEQRIVERGGKDVLGRLGQIQGRSLARKIQDIIDNGGGNVLGILRAINSTQLRDKKQTVTIVTNKITKATDQIGDALTNIVSGKKKAAGMRAGTRTGAALIGEGGAHEWRVNARTGQAYRTNGPEFTRLGTNDAIIPTEDRYKSRGREIFKAIARDLGIDQFAKGKKTKKAPKGLSEPGKAKARGEARKRLPTPRSYSTENLVELKEVERNKRLEDNAVRQIGIDERGLKEPQSFLAVIGTDPETGDPLYAVDEAAVKSWVSTLESFAKKYDKLIGIINKVESSVRKAMNRLGDPFNSKNHSGIIGRTFANVDTLNKLISREDHVIASRGTSKKERDAAKERRGVYKGAISDEMDTRRAATSDWKQLDDERNDIGFRRQDAQVSANEYRGDAAAVAGKAAADAASQAPQPARPLSALEMAQSALGGLDAEQALAAIGQGIGGAGPRSSDAITASMISANQNIINTAQGMLKDTNASNDSDAFSAISSAAQAIAGLQSSSSISNQMTTLSSARTDLSKSFGSNFAGAGIGNVFRASGPSMAGGFGINPANGGGGVNATFNQVFQQMPDPHTWSAGVAFELQAAF